MFNARRAFFEAQKKAVDGFVDEYCLHGRQPRRR
jgi:hypothetical protein